MKKQRSDVSLEIHYLCDRYVGNKFLSFMDNSPNQPGSENAKLITIQRLGLMKTKL